LFLGINAIPQLLVLAISIARVILIPSNFMRPAKAPSAAQFQSGPSAGLVAAGIGSVILVGILVFVVWIVAYLVAQCATVYAVSDLYLNRSTTIGEALRRTKGHIANLFGVSFINGLYVMAATICFIIPGIYVACRTIVCVPAALLEDLGPSQAISRSFALTR